MSARLRLPFHFFAALLFIALSIVGSNAAESDSELKFALILSRHGVRAPLDIQGDYGKYSAEAWPKWNVAPGELTPHGRKQMELMGAYYRARYVQAGLLVDDSAKDAASVYLRANCMQRTIETARAVGSMLLPGTTPEVHAHALTDNDPLFLPGKVELGKPDRAQVAATVLGRIGGNPMAPVIAEHSAFATLQRVLLGESGAAVAGKTSLLDLPQTVAPGAGESMVSLRGPIATGGSIIDSLMLEYAEGLPLADVGWGRFTPERITELLALHALWFDLAYGTPASAQATNSNLASHVADTLEQAATQHTVAGAIGPVGQKIVFLAGHDTNQIGLGALLGATWWLPGTNRNPVLLGGALVFELRERKNDHRFFVRALYISPSLEQTRTLIPLTLDQPPGLAPIFIPGCSEAADGYDAPLEKFEARLRAAIDPKFVTPSAL